MKFFEIFSNNVKKSYNKVYFYCKKHEKTENPYKKYKNNLISFIQLDCSGSEISFLSYFSVIHFLKLDGGKVKGGKDI